MSSSSRIFLSYAREDTSRAERLYSDLSKLGLKVWWDKRIKVGDIWKSRIQQAIKECDTFIICLSQKALAKKRSFIYPELDMIAQQIADLKPTDTLPIFPILFDMCEIPDIPLTSKKNLRDIQHISLFPEQQWRRGIEEIAEQAHQFSDDQQTASNPRKQSEGRQRELHQHFTQDHYGMPPRWYWEVIQDIVSIALDIPIQIFHKNAVELLSAAIPDEFLKSATELDEFIDSFTSSPKQGIKTLQAFGIRKDPEGNRLVDSIIKSEDRLCITRPSNTYSLLSSFRRRSRFWRCRDQLWALRSISKEHSNKPVYLEAIDDSGPLLEAYVLPINSPDAVMLAGPVWTEASKATGQTFQKERIDKAINLFEESVRGIVSTPILDLFRLGCTGAKRIPILRQDLYGRAEQAALAIESISTLEIQANCTFFRRCDLVQIAEWICAMLYLDNQWGPIARSEGESKKTSRPLQRTNFVDATAYSLDHSTVVEGEPQKRNLWIVSDWPLSSLEDSRRVLVDKETIFSFKRSELARARLRMSRDVEFGISPDELSIRIERQLMSMNARKNAHKGEDLALLSDILANEFGSLIDFAPNSGPSSDKDEVLLGGPTEVADIICRYTQRRLLSDVSTIYYYDYPTKTLEYRGSRIHESFRWKSDAVLEKRMRLAATVRKLRTDSMSYRAIDECSKQFVRSTEINQDDPHNRLLWLEGDEIHIPKGRSGAAVLLRYCGRPFGVMEIVGRRPFQFRWDNLLSLKEIADVSSGYFFPRVVANYLGLMSQDYLECFGSRNYESCYWNICKYACRILLGAASALWVQDINDSDLFRCAASYHRQDLDEIRREKAAPLDFSARNDSAVTGDLIRRGDTKTIVVEGKRGREPFGEKWLSEVQNRALRDSDINFIAVIPIRSPGKKIIASLTIYKNDSLTYDNRWYRLIDFLSKQCASLVELVRRPQREPSSATWPN